MAKLAERATTAVRPTSLHPCRKCDIDSSMLRRALTWDPPLYATVLTLFAVASAGLCAVRTLGRRTTLSVRLLGWESDR